MEQERRVLKDIILSKSKYFKYYDDQTLMEIVRSMHKMKFPPKATIMDELQAASHLFILSLGKVKVMVELKKPVLVKSEFVYGEQEVLFKEIRPATIEAETDCTVWLLSRRDLRDCIRRASVDTTNYMKFFKSVPFFEEYSEEALKMVKDFSKLKFFPCDEVIQVKSDEIYIISNGHLRITEEEPKSSKTKILQVLGRGQHFGKNTIGYLSGFSPGVECIIFKKEILPNFEVNEHPEGAAGGPERKELVEEEYKNFNLNNLKTVKTLGAGGFASVELVEYGKNPTQTFALKKMRKIEIVERWQQDLILTERDIWVELNNPFIVRCFKTFRCDSHVYFLMEACPGGDLKTPLIQYDNFSEEMARFIIGCVVEAISYLHSKQIIYRDLKPENLVVDGTGFIKLTDFGLSKKLGFTGRTYTQCGTEQYIPPEIILNMGHDRGVDLWSIGILLHELMTGEPPFDSEDPLEIYDQILEGIDNLCFLEFESTPTAEDLIRKLCRNEATERIGYKNINDLRKHEWFSKFDWAGLQSLEMNPPKMPPTSPEEFDIENDAGGSEKTEFSNWDVNF